VICYIGDVIASPPTSMANRGILETDSGVEVFNNTAS